MRVMRMCAWWICRSLTGEPSSEEKMFWLDGDPIPEAKKMTKAEKRKKEAQARKALKDMDKTMQKIIAAKENGVRS